MSQCKKKLDTGEQCSNRAVPGTEYCEQHQRIRFRPVTVPPAAAHTEGALGQETPSWLAQPSALGDKPAFPGLQSDARGILIAPQCVAWLEHGNGKDAKNLPRDRVARMVACLSQETPLAGNLAVKTLPAQNLTLLMLTPPPSEAGRRAQIYDAAAAAAGLNDGLLYIGSERAFIQYRDAHAPRGYDAHEVMLPKGEEWYFVNRSGTAVIKPAEVVEEQLPDLLLRIPAQEARKTDLPEGAFVLAPSPLYRLLARYFRNHSLAYRVGQLAAASGETLVLFEIWPRRDARASVPIPAFILSYLRSLPQCAVLIEAGAHSGRRFLVEWRHQYPCALRHVSEFFPENSLLLLTSEAAYASMCLAPAPTLFEAEALTAVQAPHLTTSQWQPRADPQELPLTVPLRLSQDHGPMPRTAALILSAEETAWMRALLYRLPGEAFQGCTLCLGQKQSVLVSEEAPLPGIPFGIPLRRVLGSQLFIPLRMRFVPELPWALLAEALQLKDDVFTFITAETCLEAPRAGFMPLSKVLMAEPGRPRVQMELRPAADLPPLQWSIPAVPEKSVAPETSTAHAVEEKDPGLPWRFPSRKKPEKKPEQTKPEAAAASAPPLADFESLLRERAESFVRAQEFLHAAICFDMLGDKASAGRYFREAARQVQSREKK